MTKKNINRQFKANFNFAIEMLKESKIKIFILSIIIFIAFLTGIIVAVRTHSNYSSLENFGVVDIASGKLTTTFFARLFSMILIVFICFGCSFSVYLFPLATLFLAYRGFLLGLNTCLMIIIYGFSAVVVTLIVALPCQLIALVILNLFYILMSKTIKDYKCFGGSKIPKQRAIILLITLALLFLLCMIEALLLLIFSAKVILVI